MLNQEIIKQKIKENCLKMTNGDESRAREIFEQSQGNTLDSITLREKIYKDVHFCLKCGRELSKEIILSTNGIPQCLMPCVTN